MRDPRVANLARILVGYSTKVAEGEICLIEAPATAEPLVAAVYEEVLPAGGNPVVSLAFEGQSEAFFAHATDYQLEWVSPLAEWAVVEADCRIAIGADANTRELSRVPPERQTKRQAATRHLIEGDDGAKREGRAPLGLHALSDQRLRLRGRDEPAPVRGLLLPRLPRRRREPAGRLDGGVGRMPPARRVDRGTRGGAHQGCGDRPARSESPGVTSSPATASTTCPTASSSPVRSRTRSRARSPSTCRR